MVLAPPPNTRRILHPSVPVMIFVRSLSLLVLSVVLLCGSGCRVGYYLHLTAGQMSLLCGAVPVEEALKELAASGEKNALVVPIGFVSDHLETLYDLDIVLRKKALDQGLNFKRAPSLNDSPQFIEALTEVIVNSLGS